MRLQHMLSGSLICLLAGCAVPTVASDSYPAPVPSAAQPAVAGRGDLTYARDGAEAIRRSLREMTPADALQLLPKEGVTLNEPAVVAGCVGTLGEPAILGCHFGPSASQPVAQVLLWYERGGWVSQLYPQAQPALADERREHLSRLGCRIGCYSAFRRLRMEYGDGGRWELGVVMDFGHTAGRRAEEFQLLRRIDDEWKVVWAPADGDWHYGDAEVKLPAKGLASFQVTSSSWMREDQFNGYLSDGADTELRRFSERWLRSGDGYRQKDQVEKSTPYSTLLRLIHYLSTGADEKANALLGPNIDPETVRKLLAQQPRRQNWTVTRWGEDGFLLDTSGAGKPTLGVRFKQQDEEWVLAETWDPNR